MDGASEFQIAAKANGKAIQTPLLPVDGQKVCQGLGGVVVTTVTCIDDGHLTELSGGIRRALLGMAHGDDVGIAADGVDGVPHSFTLGGGAGIGFGEA